MEAFDVFVRNYEDGKPLITLTVTPLTTMAKLKKIFAEQCIMKSLIKNKF